MLPLTFSLLAQTPSSLEVQGQINDGTSPIPGATVLIKGEQRGTVSDFNGRYKITAKPTDTLVISYMGFAIVEEPINNRTSINIQMQVDATTLREVVINAGYYNTTDRERTGSIARVTAEALERQPVLSTFAAMQGQMSGVDITQTTGVPGGGFSIRIRGQNSIRPDGNDPLYIIDGVPFASQSLGDSQVSTVMGGTVSPLNFLNPSDIASIEVLKDADATAIYGSRGANGVVLITTKQGSSGKSQFNITSQTGVGRVTRLASLMNTEQYLEMRREAFANDGISEYPANAYDVNGTWDQNRYTDWQDELLGGTAYQQNIRASVSGGNEQTRFLLGSGYNRETTVFPGDHSYNRLSVTGNLNHSSKEEGFKIQFSAMYSRDANDLPTTSYVGDAKRLAPNAPALFDEDGNLNWENGTWNNPLRFQFAEYLANSNTLIANSVVNIRLLKGLTFTTNLGFNKSQLEESRTNPSTLFNPAFGLGSQFSSIFLNNSSQDSWIAEPQLEWELPLGRARVQVLLGSSFQEQNRKVFSVFGEGFTSNNLIYNLSDANLLVIRNSQDETYKYHALYGRVNLGWNDRYFLNLTGRRDGSSRFGPDKQFATFGAVGAAWLFGDEAWIKDGLPFISFGKLRASYGSSGNDQIGNYGFLDTYFLTNTNYLGSSTLRPGQLFNPNYAWERNVKAEIAIELGFFNDRLLWNASYYNNRSSNQLVGIPLPGTTGFNTILANLDAIVENRGWEFDMRVSPIRSSDWRWTSTFNVSFPKNELVAFPGLEGSTYANQLVVGMPLSVQLLYHAQGVDPETGIFTFEDSNGDGQISAPEDRTKAVDIRPEYFGGWSNQLVFKNLELDFLFQFVKQKGWNYLTNNDVPGVMSNQPTDLLDRWQSPGDQAFMQQYTAGFNNDAVMAYFNNYNSDAQISDASFIRLKNIQLAYRLPLKTKEGLSCKVFIQGQNLLTFTKYKGPDPENQAFEQLPPLKLISTGLQLNF